MTRLNNSNVTEVVSSVDNFKKSIQDTFYNHYKNVYKMTQSNNFRGTSADAYKNYLETVTINYINAFLNVSDEMTKALGEMKQYYDVFESNSSGVVDSDTLKDIKEKVNNKQNDFDDLAFEVIKLNEEASEFISVEALNDNEIDSKYKEIKKETDNIKNELDKADSDALKKASDLLERINALKYSINKVKNDYHTNGKINNDKIKTLKVEGWYKDEITDSLDAKMKKDPFASGSDAWYLRENQWAHGLASDFYGTAGYHGPGGEYKYDRNNRVISGNASGVVGDLYSHGQFTDYLKGDINASALSGSASGKAGWNDKYKGFNVKGSVSAVDGKASVVVGSDDFNGYVKGSANALSASGNVNCEFEDDDTYNVGFGGKATFGEAKAEIGTSLFSIPASEDNVKSSTHAGGKVKSSSEKSMLAANVGVKATAGASIGAEVSSTKAYENKYIKVDAVTLKVDAALGLGFEIDVTFPTIGINW